MSASEQGHPVSALWSPFGVGPTDAGYASAGIQDVDEKSVAWSADVQLGVRLNVEITVSGEGEVHVVGYSVSDVSDPGERARSDAGRGRRGDGPVGLPVSVGGSVAEEADSFTEPDGDNRGDDGDEDAAPGIHAADDTVWERLASRGWMKKGGVRLVLQSKIVTSEVAA